MSGYRWRVFQEEVFNNETESKTEYTYRMTTILYTRFKYRIHRAGRWKNSGERAQTRWRKRKKMNTTRSRCGTASQRKKNTTYVRTGNVGEFFIRKVLIFVSVLYVYFACGRITIILGANVLTPFPRSRPQHTFTFGIHVWEQIKRGKFRDENTKCLVTRWASDRELYLRQVRIQQKDIVRNIGLPFFFLAFSSSTNLHDWRREKMHTYGVIWIYKKIQATKTVFFYKIRPRVKRERPEKRRKSRRFRGLNLYTGNRVAGRWRRRLVLPWNNKQWIPSPRFFSRVRALRLRDQ